MEAIEEQEIDFVNEKEKPQFLKKEFIKGLIDGLTFDFIKAVRKSRMSKNGKPYEEIELTLKDEFGEKKVSCFIENINFQKQNPKKVKVTVEQQDKFLNWKISRVE